MLNDAQLKEQLEKSPAARVTPEYIESRIQKKEFAVVDGTLTICTLILDNGFKVSGVSGCAKPENFNKEIGERYAYDAAFRQLWPLFGFLLCEAGYNAGQERGFGEVNGVLRTIVNNAARNDDGVWEVPHAFMQKAHDIYAGWSAESGSAAADEQEDGEDDEDNEDEDQPEPEKVAAA